MALLLGIDIETTGLDPAKDKIIEIGYVQWDTECNVFVRAESILIQPLDENQEEISLPSEIVNLTGIQNRAMNGHGSPPDYALKRLKDAARYSDYLVAHNAKFEQSFLPHLTDLNKPWIDTKTDLPYAPGKGKGTLNDIAMSHGLFNPMPHRALPDAFVMMQLLEKHPFSEVERYANAPNDTVIVTFPYDETGKRQSDIKSFGFYWDGKSKRWNREVKSFHTNELVEQLKAVGFNAHIVETELPF